MVSVSHEIPELDRNGLRSFALLTGSIVAVLFGLLLPWILDHEIPIWPWAVSGVLVSLGLLVPMSLRPVYKVWMRFGVLMSRITTPLIMGLTFYVVLTPVALILALIGKDAMARRLDSTARSYRVSSHRKTRESMEKPF